MELVLIPHWPAIRWDAEAQRYYFTQYLYSENQWKEFQGKSKWIRLATELGPVMLPIRLTDETRMAK